MTRTHLQTPNKRTSKEPVRSKVAEASVDMRLSPFKEAPFVVLDNADNLPVAGSLKAVLDSVENMVIYQRSQRLR